MTRVVPLFAAGLAVLVAGCGSSSSSSPSTSGSAPAATTTSTTSSSKPASTLILTETEFKITPSSPTAAKGGSLKVTVKNSGATAHALTVNAPSGPVSSGDIAPGASATITVDISKAGSYTFVCPIDGHARLGMKGVLVVGGASASASGGAAVATSSTTSSGSGGAYGGSGGSGY
jgi:uncharacterized cupredoxin-like copper-binding protein